MSRSTGSAPTQSGLDVFSRVIAAPRTDVTIALGANAGLADLGTLLGLLAGFYRPWIAEIVMRISDLLQAFPVFITGMLLVTLAGRSNMTIVMTLALLYTPIFVRLTRAEVMTQRTRGFVDAARALGKPERFRSRSSHVLPNSMAPALVQSSVTIGFAILHDGGLELRRRGRATADAGMGADDLGRRERTHPGRMVDIAVSRPRDLDHGVRLRGIRHGLERRYAMADEVSPVPLLDVRDLPVDYGGRPAVAGLLARHSRRASSSA